MGTVGGSTWVRLPQSLTDFSGGSSARFADLELALLGEAGLVDGYSDKGTWRSWDGPSRPHLHGPHPAPSGAAQLPGAAQ